MDALIEAQSIIWGGDGRGTYRWPSYILGWRRQGCRWPGNQVLTCRGGDGWDPGGRDAQFTIWGAGGQDADPGAQVTIWGAGGQDADPGAQFTIWGAGSKDADPGAQFTIWCRGGWDAGG